MAIGDESRGDSMRAGGGRDGEANGDVGLTHALRYDVAAADTGKTLILFTSGNGRHTLAGGLRN